MIDTHKKPISFFPILALFAIFSVLIIAGGIWWYGNQKELTKKNWDETLESIARLKVDQISRWRQEEINDALVITNSIQIINFIDDKNITAKDKMVIKNWLEQIKSTHDYANIYLLNKKGELIYHLNQGFPATLDETTLQLFHKSLASHEVLFGGFYHYLQRQKIYIDLIAPVIIREDQRQETLGGIIFIIDPQKFLYPLIQSWPTPSPSAETLLVRKEGDEVVFLNTLRHRNDAPLTFRRLLTDKNLPATRTIEGWEGALEGTDYRGVPVLAVTKTIPLTPWHMVAKIDKAEIYRPLYREARVIVVAVILLILLVGAALGWNLSRRRMQHYATVCRLEQERQALLAHFEYLVKHANDIILLLDQGGNIKEANDRAVATYGYSRDELLQLNIQALLASSESASLFSLSREKVQKNGIVYETRHRRHDASTFPVEGSVNLIQIDGAEYFQEIIRDITERKQAEEELSKNHKELQEITYQLELSRNMLQLVIESIPVRVFWKDNDLRFMGCNTLFAHDAGFSSSEQLLGKDDFAMSWKDQADLYRADDCQVMESRRGKLNIVEPQTTPAGDKIWLNTSKVPLVHPSGEVIGVLGIYEDITLRKQAEAELKLKERMLDGASDSIFLQDVAGNFLYANEAAYRSLDFTKEELLNKNVIDVTTSETAQARGDLLKKLQKKGKISFESQHLRRDGSIMPVEVHARLIDMDGRRLILSVVRDITERKHAEEAVRQTTETLRALIQASPLPILVLDPEGRVKLWNEASERTFGWTAQEAVGQVLPIVPEEKMPEFRGLLQRALDGEPLSGVEVIRRKKDGTPIDVRVYSATVYDPQGEVTGVMVVLADITLLKRAEEALRASEERYRTVADYTYDMEYWVGLDGKMLYISPACERLTGYPPQAFQEDPQLLLKTLHPEDLALFINHVNEIRFLNEPRSLDFRLVHRNGQEFWINHVCQPVIGADGRLLGRRASNRDITKRKQAEEAFQSLVNYAPIGIYIVQDGKFAMINPGCEAITGYTAQDLLGQDCLTPVSPESKEIVRKNAIQRLKGKVFSPYEYQFITKSGETGWVMETVTPTHYNGKRAVLGYFMDITPLKKLESQFLQAQKMELVGRLAGGIAHDFNNILGVIIGYSEIMMMEPKENDPLYGYLGEIKRAAVRAATLTRQLLAFSRKQIQHIELMNLNEVIAGLEKMLRRLIGEDVELVTVIASARGVVKADPGQIEQIILNLAVNARDAMSQGGKLTIETGDVYLDETYCLDHPYVSPGLFVMLAVSDNGIGMDEETRIHIFEPFYTTKEIGKGTGLGLSTVFGIVKQSGGSIEVYSEPGFGTTVKVYLPSVEEPAEKSQAEPYASPLTGHETILVVEDDDGLRPLIIDVLKMHGYEVIEARDGDEALRICKDHEGPINLMVTDVVMPRMSGRLLADQMTPLYPQMQVLFMSGYTDNAIVHHGVLDKGAAYIQKPFAPDDLAKKVREVLATSIPK